MPNAPKPATQENLEAFVAQLTREYEVAFVNDPRYAFAARKYSPADGARIMTLGIENGTASKDGDAIQRVCKHFGIPQNYKAIRSFFASK